MKYLLNRTLRVLMVFVTIISTLFISPIPTFASSLSLDEPTNYYTGIIPNTGYAMTHNIYVLKMDEKKVFCIESGIVANGGEGYTPESYISTKRDQLSKIAYYGYTLTNQSHYDYAVTQAMIWEELGDQRQSTTIPNYDQRKAEILAMVNKHDTLPSWNGQTVTVKVGDSVTLTDSNNVLAEMSLESNNANINLKHNANSLVITTGKDANICINLKMHTKNFLLHHLLYLFPKKNIYLPKHAVTNSISSHVLSPYLSFIITI